MRFFGLLPYCAWMRCSNGSFCTHGLQPAVHNDEYPIREILPNTLLYVLIHNHCKPLCAVENLKEVFMGGKQ